MLYIVLPNLLIIIVIIIVSITKLSIVIGSLRTHLIIIKIVVVVVVVCCCHLSRNRRNHVGVQSIVRKKIATGTFTYNALRTKTLKERIKTQRKIVSRLNSTRAMLLV